MHIHEKESAHDGCHCHIMCYNEAPIRRALVHLDTVTERPERSSLVGQLLTRQEVCFLAAAPICCSTFTTNLLHMQQTLQCHHDLTCTHAHSATHARPHACAHAQAANGLWRGFGPHSSCRVIVLVFNGCAHIGRSIPAERRQSCGEVGMTGAAAGPDRVDVAIRVKQH